MRAKLWLSNLERRELPAVLSVTSILDDGPGSLRQAVVTANATPGADTITFDPAVFASPRTIALKNRIVVTDALAVQGPGADKLAVSGNFLDTCFELKAGNVPISFSGLAITRSYGATSGILSFSAALTITDCVFSENMGGYGSIATTGGSLTITGSTFRDNRAGAAAGGVYTISPTTIDNCLFINNSAGSHAGALYAINVSVGITNSRFLDNRALGNLGGGAIFAESSASITLTRTTVQGNFTNGSGGGIHVDDRTVLTLRESAIVENTAMADGGGVLMRRWTDAPDDVLSLRNVTVAGNSAGGFGGGIRVSEANALGTHALRVRHATIANNSAGGGGGGISLAANASLPVEIESSILAGNHHATTPDAQSPQGLKLTHSALGSSVGVGTVTGTGALVNLDVKLSPLAVNGGITPTMFPRPDSPVRSAGASVAAVSFDQRGPGYPRLLGVQVDMGAVETEQNIPQAHASFVDIVAPTTAFTEFKVTFRDDLGIVVNSIETGDVMVVGPSGFTIAVPTLISINDLSDGTPRIATFQFAPPGGAWDVSDNGRYTVVLKAGSVFDTSEHSPLTFGPLGEFEVGIAGQYVVTNANDAGPGSLRHALDRANAYPGTPDTITFDPSYFATERTIALESGALLVGDGVTIVGPGTNRLTIDGQASTRILYVDSVNPAKVSVSGIRFVNGASGDPYEPTSGQARGGAAIFAADGDLVVADCQFLNNSSFGPGGAIGMGVGSGSLTLTGSAFVGNAAYGKTNVNTPFDDTHYHGRGGAVGGNGSGATIDACSFALNTALVGGGAVMLAGPVSISNSSFHSNSTLPANPKATGGAVAIQFGSLTISNTALTQNTAGRGGAVFAVDTPLLITNSVLDGNTATAFEGGGAISGLASKMTIDASAISNNTTGFRGAGIAVEAGSLLVTNTSITTNTSGYSGGGIFVIGAVTPDGITLRNVTLGHNRGAHNGGGLFVISPQATVNISNSTIVWNTGSPAFLGQAGGGGICVIDGATTVTLRSTIVSSNIGKFGPDIFANSASVVIDHCAIGNTADIVNLIDLGSNLIGADLKLGPAGLNGGIGETYLPGPSSPLIDAGTNPHVLATDQRGAFHFRTQGLGTDIGAVERQLPTTVQAVVINDGDGQRSMVRSLTVTFSRPVDFIGSPEAAFQLNHTDGTGVILDVKPVDGDPTSYRMRFGGPSTQAGSLADGRYTLRVSAAAINSFGDSLDGNGDGVAGDPYVMVGDPATNGLYRLFGDVDADGTVTVSDFMAFRLAFLGTKPDFDMDGDGLVDVGDFLQFRLRFLKSV